MYKGSSKIAKQLGGRGVYGQIELTCNISGKNHGIDIISPDTLEQWRTAVLSGAEYFMEHSAMKGHLFITVNDIHYNTVDTNKIVITFLTVLALADAFGTKMAVTPFFDKDSIAFVFPK